MKKLKKIKLNALSQSNLKDRDMNQIYGGNYCVFSQQNSKANEGSGKCSCSCSTNDYYSQGLKAMGDFYKATTAWGYC